tara:strand:- start:263 stop:445 length:183 start_codon:yes stop_codon:yes gene_type:complete
MEINETIKVSKKDTLNREFATYTLKISQPLFRKFKIKSLRDNHATYRETLTKLIKEYVDR